MLNRVGNTLSGLKPIQRANPPVVPSIRIVVSEDVFLRDLKGESIMTIDKGGITIPMRIAVMLPAYEQELKQIIEMIKVIKLV